MHAVITPSLAREHSVRGLFHGAKSFPKNTVASAIKLGPWETLVSHHVIKETLREHEEMRGILHYWSRAFPHALLFGSNALKRTFAERFLGVPSVIVRADYFLHGGSIRILDIKDRPSGIALAAQLNPDFKKRADEIFGSLERLTDRKIALVISPMRKGLSDDPHWASGMLHRRVPVFYQMPSTEERKKHLLLVRSEHTEVEYHDLHEESISTIALGGDRSFGLMMGLWSPIKDPRNLPWGAGVILKSRKMGTAEDIVVVRDSDLRGAHSIADATQAIEKGQVDYWQSFIAPETPLFLNETGAERRNFMTRRVFWGLDAPSGNWVSLGGIWMANPDIRMPSTRATLSGPIIPAK